MVLVRSLLFLCALSALLLAFPPLATCVTSVPHPAPRCSPGAARFSRCTQCPGTHPDGCVCDADGLCVPYCGHVAGLNATFPKLHARVCSSCRPAALKTPQTFFPAGKNNPDPCLCTAGFDPSQGGALVRLAEKCEPFCNRVTSFFGGATCNGCKKFNGAEGECMCRFDRLGQPGCYDPCDPAVAKRETDWTKCGTCPSARNGGCSCSPLTNGKCVDECADPARVGTPCVGCSSVSGAGCACGRDAKGQRACVDTCKAGPVVAARCKPCRDAVNGCTCSSKSQQQCRPLCGDPQNHLRPCLTAVLGKYGVCNATTGLCFNQCYKKVDGSKCNFCGQSLFGTCHCQSQLCVGMVL